MRREHELACILETNADALLGIRDSSRQECNVDVGDATGGGARYRWLMTRIEWASAVGLVLLISGTGLADKGAKPADSNVDCTMAAKRKARGVADKAVKAKDYKLAIATLAPYAATCSSSGDEAIETAWLIGDLAVAYELNGDYVACKAAVEPLVFPKSDVSRAGSDKLSSALQYNLDQCQKKLDDSYAALKSNSCPFAIDDSTVAAAVPASLVPKGATAACVALVGPDDKRAGAKPDDDLPPVSCPVIALVAKGPGAKLTRRVLGKPSDDETFCCGFNKIAVGVKAGQSLIRVGADSWVRECHGGTATTSLDKIFELKNNALSVVVDASNVLW